MSKKVKQHKAIVPGNGMAVNVLGAEREDLAFALKIWKRKVKSAGIVDILNAKREFVKPSVTKRAERIRAAYIQQIRSLNDKI
jgi:small subunit ribosomal protein S21